MIGQDDIFYSQIHPKCKVDGCDEVATEIWPAFDENIPPESYCPKHLEEAKQNIITGPVQYLKMIGYRQ